MHDNRPKMVDEFLVVFDVMERIARDYGLKLVMKKNIRQYFDDMTASNPASEPLRQEGLMAIPPMNQREWNQKSFQKKVSNQIKDSGLTQDQIDQQFEICCLYCVFAFQKEG